MAGVWVIVDEDGRGHAVRQAVGAQARLLAVADPFSARRALAAEPIAGLIVCVGKRTLSLRSLCAHVRREFPALPIIAVRHPSFPDDRELVAVVTDVIDDGDPQDVTDNLARVSDAFEAGEATAVLPPRPMPAAARPPAPGPTPTPPVAPRPPAAPTPPTPPKTSAPAPSKTSAPKATPTPPTASGPTHAAPRTPTRPPAAPWAGLSATKESFPPVVIGSLEPEPLVALEPPVQALRVPAAPPPRPIVMPSLPKPIVPTPTVTATLDPLGAPTERVSVPTIVPSTAPAPSAPAALASATVDVDMEEPAETTAITGGPNLSQVETTETHVGVSVGSSVESEESREPIDGSGAEVLMKVAAGRRTGRLLVVDGEGAGTLHWSAGAPVGAELPTGDGGLYRRLMSSGLVVPAQAPPIVRQGRLLHALVEAGQLGEPQRLEFERGVLRDQVLALSRQGQVHAVFVSTRVPAPATATPINVFGLILEARRRSVAPEVLAALADEIATWRITGTALLAKASHLVAPFAGGRDLAPLVVDTSARQLTLALDWDRSMGTLLLLALRDAGLILAADARPATAPTAGPQRLTNPMGMSPRQLLGVGMAPEEDDIEAAYSAHVARIDADLMRAHTTGERDALLALRERYDVARQALRLQLGFATSTGTNPF